MQRRPNEVHIIKDKDIDELKGMATNEILKNMNDDVLLDMGDSSATRSTGVLDELNDLFDITGDMGKVNISQKTNNNNNNTSNSHATDLLDLM